MEMVWSSNFHFKQFLGQTRRERERERERAREEGEEAQIMPSTSSANPELQSDDRTHQISPIAPRTAPLDLAFDLASVRSRLRTIDLSLWFWFLLLLWWCSGGVLVVVVVGVCCRGSSLEFRWCVVLGFGCDLFRGLRFGCDFEICLDAEKIAEKMWKICRKIAFS